MRKVLILAMAIFVFTGCKHTQSQVDLDKFLPSHTLKDSRVETLPGLKLWTPSQKPINEERISPEILREGDAITKGKKTVFLDTSVVIQDVRDVRDTEENIAHLKANMERLLTRIETIKTVNKLEREEAKFVIDQYRNSCRFSVGLLYERVQSLEGEFKFPFGFFTGATGVGALSLIK
jgi:hypothetical protein